MAWFARIDSQIRSESLDSRESPEGSRTEPLLLRIALQGAKSCESQVWRDSRESLARYKNSLFFCEPIRSNRIGRMAPIRVANCRAIQVPHLNLLSDGACVQTAEQKNGQRRAMLWRTFWEVCGGFWEEFSEVAPKLLKSCLYLGDPLGKWGCTNAGASQRVRQTTRDKCRSVPSPEKLFKTRDLELPFFAGISPKLLAAPETRLTTTLAALRPGSQGRKCSTPLRHPSVKAKTL